MSSYAHRAGSRRRSATPARAPAKRRTPARRPASAKRAARAKSDARFGFRLAPRSGSRRADASRIDWERFGRISLVVVLFVVVFLYINPVSNFVSAWKDKNAEQQRLESVRAQHDSLLKQAGVLKDPNAAENAARKNGMVAPGERSYVIRGIP